MLAPFVELYPETFGDLARTIGTDLLRYSEAAKQKPDEALLERVARALSPNDMVQESAAQDVLSAQVYAIWEAAEKSGSLDEAALAELPEALAEQLRAAWSERSGQDQ